MTIGPAKASMGLFKLKKSKTDAEDAFEASDEWLMGLADDAPDQLGLGPNAELPTELRSLTPPVDYDPEPIAEISRPDGHASSGWHLPDLDADHLGDPDRVASDPSAPAPPPPTPAMLFDDRHPRTQAIDPFPYDEAVAEPSEASASDAPHFDAPAFDAPRFDLPLVDTPTTDAPGLGAPEFGVPPVGAPVFAAGDALALDYDEDHDASIEDAVIEDTASEVPATEDPAVEVTDQEGASIGEATAPDADAVSDEGPPTGGSPSPPRGPEPDMLCEILGVEPGADWDELSAAHARAMVEYDPARETDPDRVALARAIRREINASYATLRLLASS